MNIFGSKMGYLFSVNFIKLSCACISGTNFVWLVQTCYKLWWRKLKKIRHLYVTTWLIFIDPVTLIRTHTIWIHCIALACVNMCFIVCTKPNCIDGYM